MSPGLTERTLARLVIANNDRMGRRATDRADPNPRPLATIAWHRALIGALPTISGEWHRFAESGSGLPRIEELIGEHQGNEGTWRAGLLVSRGRPVPALARHFPRTQAVLAGVPALRSALWSVLEPGAELPEHAGPNRGVLRYHLGVECGPDTALRVGGTVVPYRDGEGILFDDTETHAAWNRGDRHRVTLFLEVLRPAAGVTQLANRAVQGVISLDPRYRRAPLRATTWQQAAEARAAAAAGAAAAASQPTPPPSLAP